VLITTLVAALLLLGADQLAATTLVVFRTQGRIVLATDSAAVSLDGQERRHVTAPCKIAKSGRWWFINGGFFQPDAVADRIAGATTIQAALTALDADQSLRDRIVANRGLYTGRQPGSPLMTVVIADSTLSVGVFMVSLKTAEPFEVVAESGTCPGALCPTGGYYLIGEPGDAPPNPMVKALPPWFQQANAAAARRFITEQIAFTPQLAKPPVDILELTAAGPRWVDRGPGSACPVIR